MSNPTQTGSLSVSWPRRQWLKAIAVLQDYPKTFAGLLVLFAAFIVFYATQLDGLRHFTESFARWRVENFGGEHQVNRASRTSDVILSFQPAEYDRLDVLSMISLHFGGTAFRRELKGLVRRGGKIRIITLDPRIGDSDHPEHQRFLELANAFGQKPWAFRARCWYSTAVLLQLKQEFKADLQIGYISQPLKWARAPFMSPGRSSHAYQADDHAKRLDVIVQRPHNPDGFDSFSHPARLFRGRPEEPLVERFTTSFEEAWKGAVVLDEALQQSFLARIASSDGG